MTIKEPKKFLISEIHRFKKEKGRTPRCAEMTNKNGYVSLSTCIKYFGSWNNLIIASGLDVNIPVRKNSVSKKFHLKIRNSCPNCGSIIVRFRTRTNNYRCKTCHSVFDKPIPIEKLHNYLGHCVERHG